jgi:hypothetical protein
MAVIYASGVGTVSAGPVIDGIGTLAHELLVLAFGDASRGKYKVVDSPTLTEQELVAARGDRICPKCGVTGDWRKCLTASGKDAANPHKGRFDGE